MIRLASTPEKYDCPAANAPRPRLTIVTLVSAISLTDGPFFLTGASGKIVGGHLRFIRCCDGGAGNETRLGGRPILRTYLGHPAFPVGIGVGELGVCGEGIVDLNHLGIESNFRRPHPLAGFDVVV